MNSQIIIIKIVFVIISLALAYWSFLTFKQSKKQIKKFEGKIVKTKCIQNIIKQKTYHQKYNYGFSTSKTTYKKENKCILNIEFNNHDFNEKMRKGKSNIIITDISDNVYFDGQKVLLESIDDKLSSIKLCCTDYLVNSIVIGIFAIIFLGSAIFARSPDNFYYLSSY